MTMFAPEQELLNLYAPPPPLPNLQMESIAAPSLALALRGIQVETEIAVRRVQGEIFTTSAGEAVQITIPNYTTTEVTTVEATFVDVGLGETALQQVVTEDVPPVEVPSQPEVESDISYEEALANQATPGVAIETGSPIVDGYIPPEESGGGVYYEPPPPPPPEWASGAGVSGAGGYTPENPYYGSGTSSPTADLIGYGELNYDGTPIQTYEPPPQDYSYWEAWA